MKKRLSFFTLLVILLALFQVAVTAADSKSLGSFIYVNGIVEQKHFGEDIWQPAQNGDEFYAKDEIKTSEDAKAELMFENGDVIWISSLSKMTIQDVSDDKLERTKKTKLKLFWGKITNSVEKLLSEDSSFEVQTDIAVAAVKGTKFYAESDNEPELEPDEADLQSQNAEFGVYEGTVMIKTAKGDVTELNQGQALGVAGTGQTNQFEIPKDSIDAFQQEFNEQAERARDTFKGLAEKSEDELTNALKEIQNYTLDKKQFAYRESKFRQLKIETIDFLKYQFKLLEKYLADDSRELLKNIEELFQNLVEEWQTYQEKESVPAPSAKVYQDEDSNTINIEFEKLDNKLVSNYRILRGEEVIYEGLDPLFKDTEAAFTGEMLSYFVATLDEEGEQLSVSAELNILPGDKLPPLKPEGLEISLTEKGYVTLIWMQNQEEDVVAYAVYRNGKKMAEVKDIEYIDEKVQINESYDYQIKAIDKAKNESELSDVETIEVAPANVLAPPQYINAYLDLDTGKVKITWDKSRSYATAAYNVYRNDEFIGNTNNTEYTDDLVFNLKRGDISFGLGDTLTYTVKAISLTQEEGDSSEDVDIEIPDELPEFGLIYLAGVSAEAIEDRLVVMEEDLFAFNIEASGTIIRNGLALEKVEVSIDGGSGWHIANGLENWEFTFRPQQDVDIEVLIRATTIFGNTIEIQPGEGPVLFYIGSSKKLAETMVQDMRDAYNSHNASTLVNYLHTDFQGDALSLEQGLSQAWNFYDNISFSQMQIQNISKSENQVFVSVSWTKTYTMSSFSGQQSGYTDFMLELEDTALKIKRIDRDALFFFDENTVPGSFAITSPTVDLITKYEAIEEDGQTVYKGLLNLAWSTPADNALGIKYYDIYVNGEKEAQIEYGTNEYPLYVNNGLYSLYIKAANYNYKTSQTSTRLITVSVSPPGTPPKYEE